MGVDESGGQIDTQMAVDRGQNVIRMEGAGAWSFAAHSGCTSDLAHTHAAAGQQHRHAGWPVVTTAFTELRCASEFTPGYHEHLTIQAAGVNIFDQGLDCCIVDRSTARHARDKLFLMIFPTSQSDHHEANPCLDLPAGQKATLSLLADKFSCRREDLAHELIVGFVFR